MGRAVKYSRWQPGDIIQATDRRYQVQQDGSWRVLDRTPMDRSLLHKRPITERRGHNRNCRCPDCRAFKRQQGKLEAA